MSNNIVSRIFFSPHGATKKIMNSIADKFIGIRLLCDLGKNNDHDIVQLTSQDLAIIGMPVFNGRIPSVCRERLTYFQGKQTPAIIFITYGNRAYDDALLELKNIMSKQGFRVIAAAAFIAEHSIFTEVAKDRPNVEDMIRIEEFANISHYIYHSLSKNYTNTLEVKGNYPYRKAGTVPIKPRADNTCVKCGNCVQVCPVDAISKRNPNKTNRFKCIACTACINACPMQARHFHGAIFDRAKEKFEKKYTEPKNPELFY